jgi:hypothetical protein
MGLRGMLTTLTRISRPNRGFLAIVFLLAAACTAVAGCGAKAGGDRHAPTAQAAGPAPPTPDTTPIEALRTPAGLVLKLSEAPAAITPAPSPSPAKEPGKPAL